MLRNLITERFGLQYHNGKKEITSYVLAFARNSSKLKESADQGAAEWTHPPRPTGTGRDGFPILPPVSAKIVVNFGMGDRSRIVAQQVTLQELA